MTDAIADPARGAPALADPARGAPRITVDLAAWPHVSCQLPVTVPVGLAIAALETVLQQLRELYIQTEVARRSAHVE